METVHHSTANTGFDPISLAMLALQHLLLATCQAHERSLDTDILFGLICRLQPKRPDLKVVVMSATLDVDLFRRFFRVS